MLGISIVVFAFTRSIPGGPCTAILGERGTPEKVAQCNKDRGFDRPWFINTKDPGQLLNAQYPEYLKDVLRGDLKEGIQTRIPVKDELGRRFPATAELSIAAMLFAIVIGMPAGIIAALRRNSFWDNLATTISLVGVSMPVFWLGLLLSYFFAVRLGWLPPSARQGNEAIALNGLYLIDALFTKNVVALWQALQTWNLAVFWDALLKKNLPAFWDALRHLILPAIALGTIPLAIVARITRSSMLDVLGQDYVRTAKAKGLASNTVTIKHALRNALLPVVTVIGLQAGALLGGAVLTETIFSWPGIGSWVYEAISQRDYPVIQGGVIFAALVVSVMNLLVDLSYAFLDPRIQYS